MQKSTESASLLRTKHRRGITISVACAAALYLSAVLYIGLEEALNAISQLDVFDWLLILSCSLLNYILRFIRWQFYLSRLGHQLPPLQHFLYYLAGFSLTTTPGKAGETIRSLFLKPHAVPFSQSLACFFTERFLDVIIIALLSLATMLAISGYEIFVVLTSITILSVLPIVRSIWLRRRLHQLHGKLRSARLKRGFAHLLQLLDNARDLLKPAPLYTGLFLGLLAWSVQGFAFYYIMSQLGFTPGLGVLMGIYASSLLFGALSFIPGGLGATELAMLTLLKTIGANSTAAITGPVISRLSTLWFAVALGLLASLILSSKKFTDRKPAAD